MHNNHIYFLLNTANIQPNTIIIQYGETVTIRCEVVGGTVSFNWMAPAGSTSLIRGNVTTTDMESTLTFTALEEDSGEYICQTEPAADPEDSATATLTVGNYSLYTVYYI